MPRSREMVRTGALLGFLDYLGGWKWPSLALIVAVPAISLPYW